ncbi:MAG: single-stranded DNA-binding protein [Spirochaetes bacterium]|nr:single-stranded DNA-binding protein [Spirochaetota bacterium]
MQNTLNMSLLEGRLTRDPDLFYTKNGISICKFDIAVNFNLKIGDKDVNEVSFISVNTWNKVADACAKYLKKGFMVRAKGRIKQDSWVTKDGAKKNKVYIEAAAVDFLGSPKNKTEEEKVAS